MLSPHAAPPLKTSKAELKTDTGEVLTILGEINVTVYYKDYMSDQSFPSHDWLRIKLDWMYIDKLAKPLVFKTH